MVRDGRVQQRRLGNGQARRSNEEVQKRVGSGRELDRKIDGLYEGVRDHKIMEKFQMLCVHVAMSILKLPQAMTNFLRVIIDSMLLHRGHGQTGKAS